MNPVAQAFATGIILGLLLFFVLAYLGLIDRLIKSMEHWFTSY